MFSGWNVRRVKIKNTSIPDIQKPSGEWQQRKQVDGKYTWTVSGVLWNNVKERTTPFSATQRREPSYQGAVNQFSGFQEFVEWNRSQVGYACGYDLDSDILKGDLKIYSPSTCLLIPSALNRFLQSHKKGDKLPVGVQDVGNRFLVSLTFAGVASRKYFKKDDFAAARAYYTHLKNNAAKEWVYKLKSYNTPVDQRVIEYMENYQYVCDWRENE